MTDESSWLTMTEEMGAMLLRGECSELSAANLWRDEAHAQRRAKEQAEAALRVERERRGSTITCAYCYAVYQAGNDDEALAATKAHVEVCEQHPAARWRRESAALRQIAEEAIAMLNEWDETMSSYQQGTSEGTTAARLAARLAEIGGGGWVR